MTKRLRWLLLTLTVWAGVAVAQDDPADPQDDDPIAHDDPSAPIAVVPGKIALRVRPTADGLIREGDWSIVRVTLANGAAATHATVRTSEAASFSEEARVYSRTIDLPTGSKKDVQLAWRANASARDREVEILINGHAKIVQFPVRVLQDADVGVGVVGDDAMGLPAIADTWRYSVPGAGPRPDREMRRSVRTGLLPTADLPEKSLGYAALDWVVWPQADPTRLSARQQDALLAWVAGGGHLLVTVTDTARALQRSAFADALPVDLGDVTDGDVSPLIVRLGAQETDATHLLVPVTTATPKEGPTRSALVLAALDDGRPVWVAGHYGLGTVHVVLTDPSVGPIHANVSRTTLWRHLLFLAPPSADIALWYAAIPQMASWLNYNQSPFFSDITTDDALTTGPTRLAADMGLACFTERCLPNAGLPSFQTDTGFYDQAGNDAYIAKLRQLLADIPGVAPLPPSWLLAFAVTYLLFIGPIDYVVLRLLKRQPLTWITFPVLVTVFSAAALWGTSIVKGSQAIENRYEVVDILPDTGWWRGQTFLGVFSTKKTDLTLASAFPDAMVEPIGDGGFVQSPATESREGSGLFSWTAQTWSLAYVQTSWTARQPGTIDLQATLPNGVVVINNLGFDLDDAELRGRGKTLTLGPIADGEQVVASTGVQNIGGLLDIIDSTGRDAQADDYVDERAAIAMLASYPIEAGGDLEIEAPLGFIGRAEVAFEPLVLTGLTPIARTHLVVRAPLSHIAPPAETP